MVTLVAMYLPLLFVETGIVGRYLWLKDFAGKSAAKPSEPAGEANAPTAPSQKEALA